MRRRKTRLEKFCLELLPPDVVEFFSFDEALGHSLEVLLGDGAVFVEVDALKVRLHLVNPKLRHGCSLPARTQLTGR